MVERATLVNDLVAAMHKWVAVGTIPIATLEAARAFTRDLCVWLVGAGGVPSPNASAGGDGGPDATRREIRLTGLKEKRTIRDIAQLRALCDPRYLGRVTQFADVAVASDDDEDYGYGNGRDGAGGAVAASALRLSLHDELHRAAGLLRECTLGAPTREWTAANVIVSLLPFADATVELDGLMWAPLTKLARPAVQAELLFRFTQLGVYDEVRLMRDVARSAVTAGGKGSGTAETAEALLQLCVQGRAALFTAEDEAAAVKGDLNHGGSLRADGRGDETDERARVVKQAEAARGPADGGEASSLQLGPSMNHLLYSSGELRRVVIGVWLEALVAAGTAVAPIPDIDAEASLHRVLLMLCQELSPWRAAHAHAHAQSQSHAAADDAAGSTAAHVQASGRELLFALRLALRDLTHEERILHVFGPFVDRSLRFEIYRVDWGTDELALEHVKRKVCMPPPASVHGISHGTPLSTDTAAQTACHTHDHFIPFTASRHGRTISQLHGFLRLCLDLEAAAMRDPTLRAHAYATAAATTSSASSSSGGGGSFGDEHQSMLGLFHRLVTALETPDSPSGHAGVPLAALGPAFSEAIISLLSAGSARANPLRINAMWRSRMPELLSIRAFWTGRMELFSERAAVRPVTSTLPQRSPATADGGWPDTVLRWRLWLCQLVAAALDEPRLVLIYIEGAMRPAVEQLSGQSAAQVRTRTEQQPLQLAACVKAVLEALVAAGATDQIPIDGSPPALAVHDVRPRPQIHRGVGGREMGEAPAQPAAVGSAPASAEHVGLLHRCLELLLSAVIQQRHFNVLIDTLWLHSRPETTREVKRRTGSNTIGAAHRCSRRSSFEGRLSSESIGSVGGQYDSLRRSYSRVPSLAISNLKAKTAPTKGLAPIIEGMARGSAEAAAGVLGSSAPPPPLRASTTMPMPVRDRVGRPSVSFALGGAGGGGGRSPPAAIARPLEADKGPPRAAPSALTTDGPPLVGSAAAADAGGSAGALAADALPDGFTMDGFLSAEPWMEDDPDAHLAAISLDEEDEELLPLDPSYSCVFTFFAARHLRPLLDANGAVAPGASVAATSPADGVPPADVSAAEASRRSRAHLERVLLGLLVIAVRGDDHFVLGQFAALVQAGLAFGSYLPQGSPYRAEALATMLTDAADGTGPVGKYQVSATLRPFFEIDDSLLRNPIFWTEQVIVLFGASPVSGTYRAIAANPNFYYRLLQLCIRVLHSRNITAGKDIARQIEDVLDLFANQKAAMEFFANPRKPPPSTGNVAARVTPGDAPDAAPAAANPTDSSKAAADAAAAAGSSIFDVIVARSEGAGIEQFRAFDLELLASIAQSGRGVEERVLLIPNEASRSRASTAMTVLFMSYLSNREPNQWARDFEGAESMAYNLVYMFREDVSEATRHFKRALDSEAQGRALGPEARAMFTEVLERALKLYGPTGLVDQVELTTKDFLVQPRELVGVVRGVARASQHAQFQLLGEIAAQYMEMHIENRKMPLTPHHTQALAMLMFSQFYEMRTARASWSERFRAVIMQMKTGEGKSIVIAMLAIFICKLYKTADGKPMRVHILENNEGLLNRDFEEYQPFFLRFGMSSSNGIDSNSDVCYVLKRGNNRFFNEHLVQGDLELKDTILIVDEVDDLVVNEEPSVNYIKPDTDKTPKYKECYRALAQNGSKPESVTPQVWKDGKRIRDIAAKKVEGVDYTRGSGEWLMLEKQKTGPPRLPKVPLSDDWLEYKNYATYGKEPSKNTMFNSMCTPYMYNKYDCIFGLTGSVGGAAERAYIEQTYKAVAFEVPQFLNTCEGVIKQQATNLGVELVANEQHMLDRIFGVVFDYYRAVPVLIITRDADELKRVFDDLRGRDLFLRPGELQWLSERDEHGESLQQERYDDSGNSLQVEWKSVIANATKRHGTDEESYCRVTVTDYFGGRGHDYKCKDPMAEARGGMLVIATSIPDEREWIQWKGRTARQDYRGQYKVLLSEGEPMFAKDRDFLTRFRRISDPDEQIETILKQNDEGINDTLKAYSAKQARGAWLNELCEKYYRKYPRRLAQPWPLHPTDKQLRDFLSGGLKCLGSGRDICAAAQTTFGIALGDDDAFPTARWVDEWGYPGEVDFGITPPAKTMAVTFLLDFTQPCKIAAVDALQKVFDEQLDEGTIVGYLGVGAEMPIIDVAEKNEASEEAMLAQIKGSKTAKLKTDTMLYHAMDQAVVQLGAARFLSYSKWLIVLSDTVNIDQTRGNDPAALISNMIHLNDLNLAFIDTSDMPDKWKPENPHWPTWKANTQKIIGALQDKGAISVHIQADNLSKIDAAFESVAALMETGGAAA